MDSPFRSVQQVATLVGLLSLNLAGNKLARLPAEIGQLAHLKRLGLKGNILVRLPSSLGDLSNLVELYLTGNILEALPNEVRMRSRLGIRHEVRPLFIFPLRSRRRQRYPNFRSERITLPAPVIAAAQIVKLRRLRKLQLSFNNLRSLPPGMENLRSLELCRYGDELRRIMEE